MGVIIIGAGRSGTNMALEILALSKELKVSREVITRNLFQRKKWPKKFLTKCLDTQNFIYSELKMLMSSDKHLKVVWTIRDPRDIVMSKLRRGMPFPQGGDSPRFIFDATTEGAVNNIYKMLEIYKELVIDFPERVFLLKMEEVLSKFEITIRNLCKFLQISYEKRMKFFYTNMRNRMKKQRYKKLDKHEIEKWKDWKSIYNGFFIKEEIDIPQIFEKLVPVVKYFGY